MTRESKISYEILGLTVTSEIVRDQEFDHPDGHKQRVILIRSSCESQRWGKRSQDHSVTFPVDYSAINDSFPKIRFEAAEVVAKQEMGLMPEEPRFGGMVVKAIGPTEKKINLLASVDLSTSATRFSCETVAMLELKPSGSCHWEKNADGTWINIPLFSARIQFDQFDVSANILPTEMQIPCVLGGEFFQIALAEKPYLIYDLLSRDHFRTLSNIARCKKRQVLIAGKYGEHLPRLERIRKVLSEFNLVGILLADLPDIEEQSLAEKMVTFASIARFVICDDLVPSGHINELDICSERRFTTTILRLNGRAATAMQADIADNVSFMKAIEYDSDDFLEEAVREAVEWAQETVTLRSRNFNRKYEWRSSQNVLR